MWFLFGSLFYYNVKSSLKALNQNHTNYAICVIFFWITFFYINITHSTSNKSIINTKFILKMKKIEAIIRKSKFRIVKEELHKVGVNFFSYWDVTGLGNEKSCHIYRGVSYSTSDIQRRQLAIIVNDDFEEITVKTIIEYAATGEVGDGKIFVSDVLEAYRIRTGEKGGETLR